MKPVQYIIADHTLGMSPGKLAAQVAHASVEGLRRNAKEEWGNPWDSSIVNRWYQGGHYAKIVLESDDLALAYAYLQDRGFKPVSIIDEGRTEFETLTRTAIGFPVLDKDEPHVRESFSVFDLYGTAAAREKALEAQRRLDAQEASLALINQQPKRPSGRGWERLFRL